MNFEVNVQKVKVGKWEDESTKTGCRVETILQHLATAGEQLYYCRAWSCCLRQLWALQKVHVASYGLKIRAQPTQTGKHFCSQTNNYLTIFNPCSQKKAFSIFWWWYSQQWTQERTWTHGVTLATLMLCNIWRGGVSAAPSSSSPNTRKVIM